MLIRVIFLTFILLVSTVVPQSYYPTENKRRAGLRLPNFFRRLEQPMAVVQKRRIGLRLPNMLKFKDSGFNVEKRRMGMRLPNIIFLRNEKKNVLDF